MAAKVTRAKELVRDKELGAMLGVSNVTLRAWRIKGILPPKVKLAPRVTGYWRPQIEAWMRANGYAQRIV